MSDIEAALVQKIIYTAFFVPLLLSGVLVWFVVFYQKKKNETALREKDLIIKRQQALEAERTRIAAEMHDDLGGGLTSIKFLSQKLLRKIDGDENKQQAGKIVSHAQDLVGNMSEIIWAMNAGFDTLSNLVAYTRRFAFDYLEDFDLELDFKVELAEEEIVLTGERRRNIFLVVKEALHNIAKHAKAERIQIAFIREAQDIRISISDDGIGLRENPSILGNGLKNMQKRINEIGGSIEFIHPKKGMTIKIQVPIVPQIVEESVVFQS